MSFRDKGTYNGAGAAFNDEIKTLGICTKQTFKTQPRMSAFGGKVDIP